ncbi:MAG: hypothetical protein KKE57_01140 [Proteobacteria bacterium]|nr:hypothetical protein [Pseudomonadota bacterium]
MNASSTAKQVVERGGGSLRQVEEGFTVAFPMDGYDRHCQFRVWHKAPTYMCFVVKGDRHILDRLKVGYSLNMKYYETDLSRPSEFLETRIRKIKKNIRGPLMGQYLVDLEIQRVHN